MHCYQAIIDSTRLDLHSELPPVQKKKITYRHHHTGLNARSAGKTCSNVFFSIVSPVVKSTQQVGNIYPRLKAYTSLNH